MDSANKDSDEDSLARIMAKLNNKCQSYRKLFRNDCKIPLPRPSIVRSIKLASNMVVSTPMTSKYRGNATCSFDDMSSIANSPTVEKPADVFKTPTVGQSPAVFKTPTIEQPPAVLETPTVEKPTSKKESLVIVSRNNTNSSKASSMNKSKTLTSKEKEMSKSMTVITVNSSSSCHASSTLKTSRTVKQEPLSFQNDLGETKNSTKRSSFSTNRSNITGSVIEISSDSIRPEESNLSRSASKKVSPRKDSTYDVVDQSNSSRKSPNKEKDATFDVPNKSTRQQQTVTEPNRDATFSVSIEASPTMSKRIKKNTSCKNCLGCSSHDGCSPNLNKSRERTSSPIKSSKSKSGINTSEKAKKTEETDERPKSRTGENQTFGTDSVVSKKGKPGNVALDRRMSRSMSRINDSSIGGSVNKSKDNGEIAKARKNDTVRSDSGVFKKMEPKCVTVSTRMSRSMSRSRINDTSIDASMNKTKDGEIAGIRKNGTIKTDSVISKKGEPKSSTISRRVSRSMSRISDISIGKSVNETKNNREVSRSRKNETVCTDSIASKKGEPKNAALRRRISRSMSRIDDTSIGDSVHETKDGEIAGIRKNGTINTDSAVSKKGEPKSSTISRRVPRSRSRTNISIGESVNETKNNREISRSRSRKNGTVCTDSIASKKDKPKNAAHSGRVSRSMSRIDDISIGDSVHETRSKRNMSKTRDNLTNLGGMDSTLTIDKPRFQAKFTKSKIREPSVEKADKREVSRPQKDATLKEISNVMVDDATFEKPRAVSRVPNRQHKRKQSRSPAESFAASDCDEPKGRGRTKVLEKNSERHTRRREISVQMRDESLSETVKSTITPRKLTALGEIIPKVNALEKIVTYLAGKSTVTPKNRPSIPRRTICTQTGQSMEAQTSVASGSSEKKRKQSVGVGSDTIDNDEDDFFTALDIPKIVSSPNLIDSNCDNLPWRLRTPQAKPKRKIFKQKPQTTVQQEGNCPVKNIFDSLIESSDDDGATRSSPRKMYRPSAAATNRKVFINKRKTTMGKRRSTQESLRKSLLKKRSRISLKCPSLSSSSDVDELQNNLSPVVSPVKDVPNKKWAGPSKQNKRRLSVLEDFSDDEFSDKENAASASSSRRNSLAVKTPPPMNSPPLKRATNTADQYVSKILSESPMSRRSPSKRRSKTQPGATEDNTPAKSSPFVISPPSPFEDTPIKNRKKISERLNSHKNTLAIEGDVHHDEVSTSEISRAPETRSFASPAIVQSRETLTRSITDQDCPNEVSTTSELNNKNSSRRRAAKKTKTKQESHDQFDSDEPTTSSRTYHDQTPLEQSEKQISKKPTNKKLPKNPPKRRRKISEDTREGSPTPSDVSTDLRRSTRQRKPPKRLNEVGFINCRSDQEYDDWLKSRNENVFKVPDVPKTKRRRTAKKSMAAAIAINNPRGNTTKRTASSQMTNRTTDSSEMTNRTTEFSQLTNRTIECSQLTNRMTGCSQMTSFNGDMSDTVSSRAGNFDNTNKNSDISSSSSMQNNTLQTMNFSTDSNFMRIVSNNLQNLHFKSLKEDDNVSVAWTLASNSGRTTNGYLKLEPGAVKPKQISANHELSFLVFKGKAKIGVQDMTHIVSTTESFIIPKGMEYYITNLSKTEELLLMFHRFHLE